MHSPIQDLMRAVTRLTRSGRLHEATAAIQRALRRAPGTDASHRRPAVDDDTVVRPKARPADRATTSAATGDVLDGFVFDATPTTDAESRRAEAAVPADDTTVSSPTTKRSGVGVAPHDASVATPIPTPPEPLARSDAPTAKAPNVAPEDVASTTGDRAEAVGEGAFDEATYTDASGLHRYKLFVPPGAGDRAMPLVVMLHGCTQDADDFAAGTGMNDAARRDGFLVLYPIQPKDANPSRCWNWFAQGHQQRGSGEPEWIGGATRQVMQSHRVDSRRVYVAGLSAGGAMAAIVAAAYPELFAAAGVHSGLPRGAASNVAEALAVMKRGETGPALTALAGFGSGLAALGAGFGAATPVAEPVPHPPTPTIVFHGDQDRTVHPRNGEHVVAAVLDLPTAAAPATGTTGADAADAPARVERGVTSHGRRYTRSMHVGANGAARAEHWLVHGAGHAWSGGRSEGTYTDPKGPDATGAMLRFFRENPRPS